MTFEAHLLEHIQSYSNVIVAFSGGVDSAVVACAAQKALGKQALAITAQSPSVASGEVESAKQLAQDIGVRHLVIKTREIENPKYVRNTGDRCFWCKDELYARIRQWIGAHPEYIQSNTTLTGVTIFNGTNTDDLGDYRPGLESAKNHNVQSPLVECGIDKGTVREIAKKWKLTVWDKPAGPCLASRIAPGQAVTVERLSMVDQAETFLRERGFKVCRVRYHAGDLARIEVQKPEIQRLTDSQLLESIITEFKKIGFQQVDTDERGFRSGSLNELIPLLGLSQTDSPAKQDSSVN